MWAKSSNREYFITKLSHHFREGYSLCHKLHLHLRIYFKVRNSIIAFPTAILKSS